MDDSTVKTPKIDIAAILRTAALAFALINQVCHSLGRPFLPINNEETQSFVTIALTIGTAVTAWWHNNSFTKHARHADVYFKKLARGEITHSELHKKHTQEEAGHAD